jgi:lipopolysaccharide export system protein LptA
MLLLGGGLLLNASRGTAQESFLNAFVGPGEKMILRSDPRPDGTIGTLNAITNPDGSFNRFEGEGLIVMESPKLNLKCEKMVYDGASGILTAKGNVQIAQEGIDATCADLNYDTATGEIRLQGTPVVKQKTEKNTATFDGMDTFVIKKLENGSSEIQMAGGNDILCAMEPLEAPVAADGTTPTPTATPAEGAAAAPADTGFAGLGNNVKINTKAKDDQNPPSVFVNTTTEGAFEMLRAYGLVELESDTMNLRAESLEYDGVKDMVEALYNVYIKQQEVEANCGRMEYEVAKEKIVLTVNPEVRQTKPDGVLNITQMDSFVMQKNADGTTSTQAFGGPDGSPKYEYEAIPVKPVKTGTGTEAIEINPDDPNAMLQIKEAEKDEKDKKSSGGGKSSSGKSLVPGVKPGH